MRTFFAMHCITRRNKNDNFYNKQLEELGYDEAIIPDSQMPNPRDIAQGQIDEPLIEKGKFQAKFLGTQAREGQLNLKRIYCANQKRCIETANIIAGELDYPVEIIVDERINARSYGEIAKQGMDTDKLKHFWKYKIDFNTLKMIALYLAAPEKIGAEPKSDFKSRVESFIHDIKYDFDDSLIVAGSDVWGLVQDQNYFYSYKNEKTADLRRGQFAFIDFSREKEVSKSNQSEQGK